METKNAWHQMLDDIDRQHASDSLAIVKQLLSGGINRTVSLQISRVHLDGKLTKYVEARGYDWNDPDSLKTSHVDVHQGESWLAAMQSALDQVAADAHP